jgi:hypothetical protein
MSKILFNMLAFVIARLIDAKVFEIIKAMVISQMSTELNGEQKRAEVKKQLDNLTGNVADEIKKTAPNLINLAIETSVALIKK